jgi:hypothetical protein
MERGRKRSSWQIEPGEQTQHPGSSVQGYMVGAAQSEIPDIAKHRPDDCTRVPVFHLLLYWGGCLSVTL